MRATDRLWAWTTHRIDTLVTRAIGPEKPTPPPVARTEPLDPATRAAIRKILD